LRRAGFDSDQRAARRQRSVGRADQVHLLFQLPVVKNHAHRYDVRLGQRIVKKIATGGAYTVGQPGGRNVSGCDRLYGRRAFSGFQMLNSA
jgi:hypothetical protein